MRSAALQGKTVKRIRQQRYTSHGGRPFWTLDAIEFTDGSVLHLDVVEGENEYGIDAIYTSARSIRRTVDTVNKNREVLS